jgi:hypothetical protein
MNNTMVRVATTPEFYALAQDSIGRNRGPSDELLKTLDLDGVHVLAFQMLHNDKEWRALWLCKLIDSEHAARVWMDNGPAAYEHFTSLTKVSDG